jgi:adenosylmethionine-8-amino-7-oxononanoate aminotransferase
VNDSDDLRAFDAEHLWHPFTQAGIDENPRLIVRGKGAYLYDADGNALLDLISSWWVNLHGHAHETIANAIARQARELEHVLFAGFTHPAAVRFSQRLLEQVPDRLARVFFSDNGSTAVEVALKMALQYWHNRGQTRTRIVALEGGYHGDTFGAMAAGRSSGFFGPFEPLLFDVDFLPYPEWWLDHDPIADEEASLSALERLLERRRGKIAALIVEPLIQGAGGMRIARASYVRKLVERVRAEGIIVIFDEVMTGFGRTGTMFALDQVGIAPDLLCLSKGMTGGFLPLGATLATNDIFDAFVGDDVRRAFLHGHSYTANPLACAAAEASLDVFAAERTMERVAAIGAVQREQASSLRGDRRFARPRVLGTIAAVDVARVEAAYGGSAGRRMARAMLDRGFLVRPLGRTIYFMPPYCVTASELRDAYAALRGALNTAAVDTMRDG